MTISKLTAAATAALITTITTSGQETFSNSALIEDKYDVLSEAELSHVYDYDWFYLNDARLNLESDLTHITDTEDGSLYIRAAKILNYPFPKQYGGGFEVQVQLTLIETDSTRHDYTNFVTYCTKCGTISRKTPTITINGSEDTTVVITYGENIGYATTANGKFDGYNYAGQVVATYADGDKTIQFKKSSILDAGHYAVTLKSLEIGNNTFNPRNKVFVGYKELSKQFDVTIKPKTVTYTGEVTIAPRDADGTTTLGEVTLPTLNESELLTKNNNGVADTASIVISEWDLSDVAASAGTYEVRYKLGVSNPNYSLSDEDWHSTTFTINPGEEQEPTPEPEPEPTPEPEPEPTPDPEPDPTPEPGPTPDTEDKDKEEGSEDEKEDESGDKGEENDDDDSDGNDCLNVSITVKFGNTLVVDNSGDKFTAYQWILNDEEIEGATKQYIHQSQLSQGVYTVRVMTENGEKVSCPYTFAGSAETQSLTAYPNPVQSGRPVTIAVEQGATEVSIFNSTGALEQVFKLSGESIISTTLQPGSHIISVKRDGRGASSLMLIAK